MGKHPEFKVGDRVIMLTTGRTSCHYLRAGIIVTIMETETNEGCVVQASGSDDFDGDDGWSREGMGAHLQHVKYEDFERAYSNIPLEKALSASSLPLL